MTPHDFILHEIARKGECEKRDVIEKFGISHQLMEVTLNNFSYDYAIWDDRKKIFTRNMKNVVAFVEEY